MSNFGVDENFLKGRGFGTVCPGATNLVSKVARDLKVKSQRAARSKNFARQNGREIVEGRGGDYAPPPGNLGLKAALIKKERSVHSVVVKN